MLLGLPLTPFVALCLDAAFAVTNLIRPLSFSQWIIYLRHRQQRQKNNLRQQLINEALHDAPRSDESEVMLGPIWPEEKHLDFPTSTKVVQRSSQRYMSKHRAQWLGLQREILPQHGLILGQTGSGKTEAIKRMAYEIATQTDYDLFLVDGKGESDLCDAFRSICHLGGRGNTPVFRLGHNKSGHSYDGFQGSADAIYNRIMALAELDSAEGNAVHYQAASSLLLQLACKQDPQGPPRSFHQLTQRCDLNYLRVAFKNDPISLNQLDTLREKDIAGLLYRLHSLTNDLAPVVNPNGFVLGGETGVRSAVFSIRTQSVGYSAKRYFAMLLLDLLDIMGHRQERPMVVFIDEFGTLIEKTSDVVKLLSLGRSSEQAVILATQEVASLGDEITKEKILSNARNRLLMASDAPDEVSALAGTILQVEQTLQTEEGAGTSMGTVGARETFAISPNDVAQLGVGESYFIRQRYTKKLLIKQVTNLPAPPPEPAAKPYVPQAPNDLLFRGKRLEF